MKIIGMELIDETAKQKPHLKTTLDLWVQRTEDPTAWQHRPAMEQSHPSVDYHGKKKQYIFIIKDHRLIANVSFTLKLVDVIDIMDHSTYEKWSNGK